MGFWEEQAKKHASQSDQPDQNRGKNPSYPKLAVVLITAVALFLFVTYGPLRGSSSPTSVTLSSATQAIAAHHVASAVVDDQSQLLTLHLKNGTVEQTPFPYTYGTTLTKDLLASGAKVSASAAQGQNILISLLQLSFPVILIIAFLLYFMRKHGGLGVTRFSSGKDSAVKVPSTRFTDIAGSPEVVRELEEVVEFLHNPTRFTAAGARLPHGFLLVGPPGTGKTLLAQAVAGEAGVPFFALAGSDFVEAYVGVGAARVRTVFEKAKKAGRAIIFIDEIDAIGRSRSSGPTNAGQQEHENTLIALLSEMQGFSNHQIIILAATNRPDVLDRALTRPGRFDRTIEVPAPDRKARLDILRLHARGLRMDDAVDLESLARRTVGMTGADLSQLLNEAALESARRHESAISPGAVEAAYRVTTIGRERRSAALSEKDQRITAYHEAGHAVAALLLPDVENPVSVSIIPTGRAGGVTWMGGRDDNYSTKSQLLQELVVMLGGRAGEMRLLNGDFTHGAASDLKAATDQCVNMITRFGMGKSGMAVLEAGSHPFETISKEVKAEVNEMIAEAFDRAKSLLRQHSGLHGEVATALLEREELSEQELCAIAERWVNVPVSKTADARILGTQEAAGN